MMLRKRLALFTVLLLLAPLGAHLYKKCLAAGPQLAAGQQFHVLVPGTAGNFVVRGTTDVHLLSYYVLEKDQEIKPRYTLNLAFLTKEGAVAEQRNVEFSVATDETQWTLPDGAALAELRLLPLSIPPGAVILRLGSPDGRVLVRANQLLPNHGSQEAVLERSGRPASWFAADELQGLDVHGWGPLPALYELPTIKLPLVAGIDEQAGIAGPIARSAPLRVEPHRALVVNVEGPGEMTVLLKTDNDAPALFQLDHVGPRGTGRIDMAGGRAAFKLPAGPSSVVLRPLSSIGATVRLVTHKLHALGRTDEIMEAAARLSSAYRLAEDKPLRYSFEEMRGKLGPVRLSAHAVDVPAGGNLLWRLIDAEDHELGRGTLSLSTSYDLFTALMEHGLPVDLGETSKIFVNPPPEAIALEVSAPNAVVNVEMLMESGAEPGPLPPYDEPLGPMVRWHDVPVHSPRWLMLRPLSKKSEQRQLYASLLRMPRIEPIGPLPQGPWVSVAPSGVPKVEKILERAEHPNKTQDIQTLVPTGEESEVVLNGDGKNARRVVLSCDLSGQLGGELVLRIDGRRVAKTSILTSNVRLVANAPRGVHRVRIEGAPPGRCTVAARPSSGPVTVRRSVYLLSQKDGLTVKVKRPSSGPVRLHYAIYSEGEAPRKDVPFEVTVDNGSPKRSVGSSPTFTIARPSQTLHFTTDNVPLPGNPKDSALNAIAVSAVQLGQDLPVGSHRIKFRAPASGRYWARFWIEGRRHRLDTAESIITTDPTDESPANEEENDRAE